MPTTPQQPKRVTLKEASDLAAQIGGEAPQQLQQPIVISEEAKEAVRNAAIKCAQEVGMYDPANHLARTNQVCQAFYDIIDQATSKLTAENTKLREEVERLKDGEEDDQQWIIAKKDLQSQLSQAKEELAFNRLSYEGNQELLHQSNSLVLELKDFLNFAHNNWSDFYHDAVSSCKICKLLEKTAPTSTNYIPREEYVDAIECLKNIRAQWATVPLEVMEVLQRSEQLLKGGQ